MINVFFNGIEKEACLKLIEHMVNAINTFASHGSGWIVERIEKLVIYFAACSPIRAGSYIDLPDSLKPVKERFNKIKRETIRSAFYTALWPRTMIDIQRPQLLFILLPKATNNYCPN